MIKIAPSILSADFSRLGEEVCLAEEGGADYIHVDVMDGHFVPNITVGPVVVQSIRHATKLPLDVHLMIERPGDHIDSFVEAGSDIITIHVESQKDIARTLEKIRRLSAKAGLSLKPTTPLSRAKELLPHVDMLLLMTVNPGFPGQKFMPSVLPKIERARRSVAEMGLDVDIEVDGGINRETAPEAVKAGANVLVAGSAIFSGDVKERIRDLRESVREVS